MDKQIIIAVAQTHHSTLPAITSAASEALGLSLAAAIAAIVPSTTTRSISSVAVKAATVVVLWLVSWRLLASDLGVPKLLAVAALDLGPF